MEKQNWQDILLKAIEDSKKEKRSPIKNKPLPKERIVLSAKEEGLLWFEMLKALKGMKTKNGVISFPAYFEAICRKFSMTKARAWNCLFFLAEFDLVEIVKCHGLRLKYKIEEI